MRNEFLETFECAGFGYKPVLDFRAWRVAYLRYCDDYAPTKVSALKRHVETDEVLVLLNGHAILFIGGNSDRVKEVRAQILVPGKIYNVKHGTWHAIIVSQDANMLVVENSDTSKANTEFTLLKQTHKKFIIEAAHKINDQLW